MTRTVRTICLVAAPVIVAGLASTAHGHARLKKPAPRDNRTITRIHRETPSASARPAASRAGRQPNTC